MPRGRPVKSEIRQNILEILHYFGRAYGYKVAKIYNEIFAPVSMRSIYYHLKKGVSTGEILLEEIKEEKGEFSWGNSVEKLYYSLDGAGSVKGDPRVREYFLNQRRENVSDQRIEEIEQENE